MKKKLLPFIVLMVPVFLNAQIVTTSMSADSLVRHVLLGSGVNASNVTYTGYPNGISKFTADSATQLGITEGLYLTTGSYLQSDPMGFGGPDGPMGPSSNFQSVSSGYPGDSDLDSICGANTNDAAVLEFDFIPQSDTVKFRYVFGSEEYNEFVNSFNDVFAFILSGVSTPLAATNIALIPGTSTPVSIDNVNNGNSSTTGTGPCMNCAYYRDNYTGSVDVVYDGITVVLTAFHPVICGETYHIKLAVADAWDGAYDSGVFLEAGSLTSLGTSYSCTPNVIRSISANSILFDIFPNPGNGWFEIRTNEGITHEATVRIYDITGKLLMQNEFNAALSLNSIEINACSLDKGIYFVELASGLRKATRKIVIE